MRRATLYLVSCLACLVSAESFYDNPEQDPLPAYGYEAKVKQQWMPGEKDYAYEPGKVPKEELERLWDFEVCLQLEVGKLQSVYTFIRILENVTLSVRSLDSYYKSYMMERET